MSEQGVTGRPEVHPMRERGRAANPVVPLLRQALRSGRPHREPPHPLRVAIDRAAALGARDAAVRGGAARALGALGTQAARAVPRLFQALGDADSRVRRAAAEALANVGATAGAPPRR